MIEFLTYRDLWLIAGKLQCSCRRVDSNCSDGSLGSSRSVPIAKPGDGQVFCSVGGSCNTFGWFILQGKLPALCTFMVVNVFTFPELLQNDSLLRNAMFISITVPAGPRPSGRGKSMP